VTQKGKEEKKNLFPLKLKLIILETYLKTTNRRLPSIEGKVQKKVLTRRFYILPNFGPQSFKVVLAASDINNLKTVNYYCSKAFFEVPAFQPLSWTPENISVYLY
jgi:hypothetical protein